MKTRFRLFPKRLPKNKNPLHKNSLIIYPSVFHKTSRPRRKIKKFKNSDSDILNNFPDTRNISNSKNIISRNSSLFIFLCILILFFYSINRVQLFLFKVQTIACTNQNGECNQIIGDKLAQYSGTGIFQAKKDISEVLSKEALVKEYEIRYSLPANLSIYILERQPEYALSISGVSWNVLVDKDGRVVSVVDETDLTPLEVTETGLNPGVFVSNDTLHALKIVKNVDYYYKINKAKIKESSLIVDLEREIVAVFPLTGEVNTLTGALRLLLLKLNPENELTTMESKDVQKIREVCKPGCIIDLRFKNPIIKNRV